MTDSALGKALDDAYNRFKIAEAMEIAMENSMKKNSWEYSPEEMKVIRKLPPTELLTRDNGEKKMSEISVKRMALESLDEAKEAIGTGHFDASMHKLQEAKTFIHLCQILWLKELTPSMKDTEKQPQPDEINDPISRFKPY